MIASFFDIFREVYGHVVDEVLNVYADFDGSGRRCSRRHAAGDVPVLFLNTRVKWLCSAKPVTSAISERDSRVGQQEFLGLRNSRVQLPLRGSGTYLVPERLFL